MESKSIVKTITYKKEWKPGKHIHTVSFENNDAGDFFNESNPPVEFKVGQEIEYIKETKINGSHTNTTIRLKKQGGAGGPKFDGKGQKKIAALNAAVALVASGKADMKVLDLATVFNKWLNE